MYLAFLLFWDVVVAGDSPQFSLLNAQSANCIGFAITIFSIQLLNAAADGISPAWLFVLLAPGPLLGLLSLKPLLRW